jgi:hypothetical protein
MHKPFIDFTFEIGSLNVMNIGAAEYNVASKSPLSLSLSVSLSVPSLDLHSLSSFLQMVSII